MGSEPLDEVLWREGTEGFGRVKPNRRGWGRSALRGRRYRQRESPLTQLADGRHAARRRTLRVHSFLRGTCMASDKNTSTLTQLSSQLSAAVEQVGGHVVAVHARRRIPSSGVIWRDGVIASASHTVRRDGDVRV